MPIPSVSTLPVDRRAARRRSSSRVDARPSRAFAWTPRQPSRARSLRSVPTSLGAIQSTQSQAFPSRPSSRRARASSRHAGRRRASTRPRVRIPLDHASVRVAEVAAPSCAREAVARDQSFVPRWRDPPRRVGAQVLRPAQREVEHRLGRLLRVDERERVERELALVERELDARARARTRPRSGGMQAATRGARTPSTSARRHARRGASSAPATSSASFPCAPMPIASR